MKIKIKLKTLILITMITLIFILFIVPVLNLEIANALKENGSDKAEIFYRSYMKSPIRVNQDKGLYSYADELTKGLNKYQITSTAWGGAEMTSPENMKKAMELYEEVLVNNKKDKYTGKYAGKAYTKLLDTSIATLDADKLEYWIKWGMETENETIQYISKLYRAYYKFTEKSYKEADALLKELDQDLLDEKYYQLMANVNLHLNNISEAEKNYKRLAELAIEEGIDRSKTYFGGSYMLLDEYAIEENLEKIKGEYKVKGKITHDGKGLPFVEVYLNKDIGSFNTLGKAADAVTDKNGEFETFPLKQGVYDINMMINPSQLYEKVFLTHDRQSIQVKGDTQADFEFTSPIEIISPEENIVLKKEENLTVSWRPVEGAEYYKVKTLAFSEPKEKAGSVSGITIKNKSGQEKLKTNNIDFGFDNIDKKPLMHLYDEDGEIINPRAILASFIPNIENPIIVEAYDKEEKLLSSSITLISDYDNIVNVIFDTELTQGEKLILDSKYKEAVSHYENILNKDSKDKESLLYLTRMYRIGWKKGESDIQKALKYAKDYDDNYDDYNLSLEVIEGMNTKQKKENGKYIKDVLENSDIKDRDHEFYYIQAGYFISEGEFLKARESYEKVEDYKALTILYIDMYLGNYDKSIKMLQEGELSIRKMNEVKAAEVLKKMETFSSEDKDLFKEFLKVIIEREMSMSEQSQAYYKTLKAIKSPDLKDLLEEIAKEEYLENEYIIEE